MRLALECLTRCLSRQTFNKRSGCSRTRIIGSMRARWITMSSQCQIRASPSSTRITKCRCNSSSYSRWWSNSNRSRNTTLMVPTSWSRPWQRAATSTSHLLSRRKTSDNFQTCSSSSNRAMSRNGTRSLIRRASKMPSLSRTSSPLLIRVIMRCWSQRI